MAQEPDRLAFRFGVVIAVAVIVLTILTWASRDWAAPIPPTIYAPQHLIVY